MDERMFIEGQRTMGRVSAFKMEECKCVPAQIWSLLTADGSVPPCVES